MLSLIQTITDNTYSAKIKIDRSKNAPIKLWVQILNRKGESYIFQIPKFSQILKLEGFFKKKSIDLIDQIAIFEKIKAIIAKF